MKKLLFTASLLIIIPIACSADFDVVGWKYFKNIKYAGAGLMKVALDDEIFSGSQDDLRDLRVIDNSNAEIPFKIISGRQDEAKATYAVRLINNSFVPGKFSTAILDLGKRGIITNNLHINTPSENFQQNVKIYGSDDMYSWNILKDNAYIYDYTDEKASFKSQNTDIYFPESVFQYLKIEIDGSSNSPVQIASVAVNKYVGGIKREFERHPSFSTSENRQKRTTEITVDLGSNGIPVNKIFLKAKGDNFNRAVSVSSSKDNGNWESAGQGYIFRYTTSKFNGENMLVDFPETNNRYLKIEIINKDDQPLAIDSLTAFSVYRDVVFQAEKNMNYRIFYGNPRANYPEYDLDKFFQYLGVENAQIADFSGQMENPNFIAEKEAVKPLSEEIPYLFPSILVLASLGLLVLVYKFFQKN